MVMLRKSQKQELPELGEMYEFDLGLTPNLREDFKNKLELDGYDEEVEEFSDEALVDEMRASYCGDRVREDLRRINADKISGRLFIFHEAKDDLARLLLGQEDEGIDVRTVVYDEHREAWGLVPERVREMELREKVTKVKSPAERRKIWKEIRELNQRVNALEEALTEILPDEDQREIQENQKERLLLNLIAIFNKYPVFDAESYKGLAVKGGHPHNALVGQHYLELAVQKLGNPKYELVSLKKYLGTDALAVSEWVNKQKNLDISQYTDSGKLIGNAELTRLVDAYRFGDRYGGNRNLFTLDESVDSVLLRAKSLVRKLYKGGEFNPEEKEIVNFYVGMVQKEAEKKFDEREESYRTFSEAETDGYWKKRLEELPKEREKSRREFSDLRTAKKKVRDSILSDYGTLVALRGYHALFRDLEKIRNDGFVPENGIFSYGRTLVDVRLEHILFRGINGSGIPRFSIIDMYHLGSGEFGYKARITGYDSTLPKLSLRP
ncbi:MAG: hypothetical protein AB1668_06515 [Nanoarchaeota archaeon]